MKRKVLSIVFTLILILSLIPNSALAASSYSDVKIHWAQTAINKWSDLGIIKGAGEKFRPNDPITRGEIAVIIDRIMKYQTKTTNHFYDLGTAFYTDAILKANAAGVIHGSGNTVRPKDSITKEEAATMLGRALGLSEAAVTSGFLDRSDISPWASGFINAMVAKGYIHGTDGKYRPDSLITRAEVVTILNNSIGGLYTAAQEYTGDVTGTVIVNTAGAILKNMTINGDLIIAEGIGNGNVTLNNVIVTGNTIVRGGGPNSILITGTSHITTIIIEKTDDGSIRVVASEGTVVDAVYVDDGNDEVILTGSFENVTIAADIVVKAVGANIRNLEVTGENISLDLDEDSKVANLKVDTKATITNNGTILNAQINANGVIINGSKPKDINVGAGVTEGPKDSRGNNIDGGTGGTGGSSSSGSVTTPLSAIGVITGTAQVGSQITAGAVIPTGATASYQWSISLDGTNYTDIAGATSNTYTPVAGDMGKFIKVAATGTGSFSGSVTSASTAAVMPEPNVSPFVKTGQQTQTGNATPASINGSIIADRYSVNTSIWFEDANAADTLTYVFVSALEGANDVAANVTLNAATGALAYTPAAAQATKAVTIVVKANDGAADSTSNVTITINVGAVPENALNINWCGFQWPPSANVTVGSSITAYARVYIAGVTEAGGDSAHPYLKHQIGYGADGTDPNSDPSWIWFDATFNVQSGNEDEYNVTFKVFTPGAYDMCARFSGDKGNTWVYGDLSLGSADGYSAAQAAPLTVTP